MLLEGIGRDLRFAVRSLIKNPGFTIIAVLVLAIGIGANTATFSLVNSVLLRPLPYPEPERLVVLRGAQPGRSSSNPLSYPEFAAWKNQTDVFEELAAYAPSRSILTELGEPEQLSSMMISANLLRLTGTTPALGRNFLPEEDTRQSTPVAMISHSFWKSHLHSDPAVLGRKLRLTDRVYSIVGVLPQGFRFADVNPEVIVPLRLDAQIAPAGLKFLNAVGRLRPGVTAQRAATAIQVDVPEVKRLATDTEGAVVIPLKQFLTGDSPALLWELLGAVAFVLVIACSNVANLLIARAAAREKEIAIRISLGAERSRLMRQLLTESTLLAVIGGVLGLLLGSVCLKLMSSFLADRLPRASEVHMDFYVLGFTAAVAIVAGFLFGLAPAFHAVGGNLQQKLKQNGRQSSNSYGSQRLRQSLVVVEMVFSLVLLAGAGLLLRSFMRLLIVDKGFESDHVITMAIQPSPLRYFDPNKEINYLQQILSATQALPGVQSAGYVTNLPLLGNEITGDVSIQGRAVDPRSPIIAVKQFTGGDYFQVLHVPLIKGRYLKDSDTSTSPRVAVINEALASRYFAGQDPIGNHIDVSWGAPGWSEIVGVVSNTKQGNMAAAAEPAFYAPLSQKPELLRMLEFSLAVRTGMEPSALARPIIGKIHELDSNQAVSKVQTMDQIVADSLAGRRVSMLVLGVFSAIGLFLAAIGIYGVLSYYVLQRRQEIGVRLALGAQRTQVLRLILGHAAKLIAAGVVAGLIVSFATLRLMARFLFNVQATDPATFAGVSVLLTLLALLACTIPALRATHVDPLVALRNE
jgi:putative ABC transport system permease protein